MDAIPLLAGTAFGDPDGHANGASTHAPDEPASGSVLLQISNAIVRLYKEAFGRGPTKATSRRSFARSWSAISVAARSRS